MQRLFSTFPNGWPGLGLLLLRSAAGSAVLYQSVTCLSSNGGSTSPSWAFSLLGMLAGVLLFAGLLTPLASTVVIACNLGFAFAPSSVSCHPSDAALAQTIVVALSIALLGPGAISLDSRLFGRREIIIPDSDPTWPPR
ncbi:hypothetical protein [Edaphobacter aggregans]|uniref:hypothetical protein n=1 Tax=Edaphobacter aggregans TaxID=570835 RepID=UPI00068C70D0|nr:hypothetical protein [Edaphobacter aggregans]